MRILLSLFLFMASASPALGKWREASTNHFVIYSEESEEALRKFATRLERYDSAMRQMHNIADINLGPANRLTIYVVSNTSAVRRLSGTKDDFLAGFYIPRAGSSLAIIPRKLGDGGQGSMDSENVLLHEYAHHFLFQNFAAAYPAWFSEGFAEFYSVARFEKDESVGLGLPALHRGYWLMQGNPLPVDRMMALGTEKLDSDQREALYGRGWLLTHYLTFDKSRAGQLGNYLKILNSGKTGIEAATAAFGDLKTLGRDLDVYLKRKRMSYLKLDATVIKTGPIAIRDVSPSEDALMTLKIQSKRGVNDKQAKELLPEFRRLAAPFPKDVAAQSTLAEAEYDAGNYKEAEAAADLALAIDGNAIDALTYKGMAKMAMAEDSEDAALWKDVRRWFLAANKVDPHDPEPLILFYLSFQEQGIPPTENAIAALNHALELAPQDRNLRMNVAYQFLIDGKARQARETLIPIAFDPHAGEQGKAIAAIIARIDAGGTREALEEWNNINKEEAETAS